jgi:hypothetical protein
LASAAARFIYGVDDVFSAVPDLLTALPIAPRLGRFLILVFVIDDMVAVSSEAVAPA